MNDRESETSASVNSVTHHWLSPNGVTKISEERLKGKVARPARENGASKSPIAIPVLLKIAPEHAQWVRKLLIERLSYLLILAPTVIAYVETGRLVSSPAALLADVVVSSVILAFVLLMRHTRKQAEQIDGLRRTLNEAIIHDLKNPLTSIMACVTCMIDDSPGAERQKMLMKLALHSCRDQMTLIDTLIDTSRLEHGELAPQKQPLNVRNVLAACLHSVRGTATYLGVKLKVSISDSLPTELSGDPELLPRVFFNLLLNALKYTPRGGSVSLNAGYKDGGFHFEVRDTGIGISSTHIKNLFKKYYRVEGPHQGTRRGSGLGLYFCRLVVEAHGGTIDVKSDAGRGTGVTFNIPQAPANNGRV